MNECQRFCVKQGVAPMAGAETICCLRLFRPLPAAMRPRAPPGWTASVSTTNESAIGQRAETYAGSSVLSLVSQFQYARRRDRQQGRADRHQADD